MRRSLKIVLWTVAGTVLTVLLLLVAAQIALSPRVCASLVDRYAPQFVEGKVEMDKIYVSVFRRFPSISAHIENLSVTYPSSRFKEVGSLGAQGLMTKGGTFGNAFFARRSDSDVSKTGIVSPADSVEAMDTLASFSHFDVSVSPLSLLRGTLRIRKVELSRPRVFLHRYADGTSNLDIFKGDSESDDADASESSDSTSSGIPSLSIGRVAVTEGARVIFTDQKDTVFITATLRRAGLGGRLVSDDIAGSRFRTGIDSLRLFGRIASDTLAFGMDHLGIRKKDNCLDLDAQARLAAATRAFGRLRIPVSLQGRMTVDRTDDDTLSLNLKDFNADIASVKVTGNATAELRSRLYVKGKVEIPSFTIQPLLNRYARNFFPEAAELSTDAALSAALSFDGHYDGNAGILPGFTAYVDLPECMVSHPKYDIVPKLKLRAEARAGEGGPVNADISGLSVSACGVKADLKATAKNLLGDNPRYNLNASLSAALDSLGKYMGDALEMSASGFLKADISGKFSQKELNLYNVGKADLKAELTGKNISVRSWNDSLNVFAKTLGVQLSTMDFRKSRRSSAKRGLGASLDIDSLTFNGKGVGDISGKNLKLTARTSGETVKLSDSVSYNPLLVKLDIGRISLKGEDSLRLILAKSSNSFSLRPVGKKGDVTSIRISSDNGMVSLRSPEGRIFLRKLNFSANARNDAAVQRKKQMDSFLASVYRRHPDWNRDSLTANFARMAASAQMPEWMSEEDFRKSDIKLDLSESARKLFSTWTFKGRMSMTRAGMATPSFPLRTSIRNFKGSFDNSGMSLDSLSISAGASKLSASGRLSNLDRLAYGRGIAKASLILKADTLALNQLLNAYAMGQRGNGSDLSHMDDAADDEQYQDAMEAAASEAAQQTEGYPLIVLPANLDAEIMLLGRKVNYSTMDIDSLQAKLILKERCLQLADVKAVSNIGDISLDAFYSTRTKQNILTGFDLNLERLSAEDVISLMPQIDTVMPLLKSFGGNMNCNIAATARIDTNMNVLSNSIDGVLRISGKNLHFQDSKEVEKIAKMLMFKNPGRVAIDTMMVEGVIKDSRLEIFPFILSIDRWTLALAGIQSLDKSFNYHVSLIKSPLLVKFGANISGKDFDNMNLKLGKALYKDGVVPVFSQMIDESRINLRSSIEGIFDKGVERAVREQRKSFDNLQDARKRAGYRKSAAESSLEGLSDGERGQLDSLRTPAPNYPPDQQTR